MKWSLNSGEQSSLAHCLMVAAENFAEHARYLGTDEAKEILGATTARQIQETYEMQANDASTLRRRIENADQIEITNNEPKAKIV